MLRVDALQVAAEAGRLGTTIDRCFAVRTALLVGHPSIGANTRLGSTTASPEWLQG
jgi:hypothetical protein